MELIFNEEDILEFLNSVGYRKDQIANIKLIDNDARQRSDYYKTVYVRHDVFRVTIVKDCCNYFEVDNKKFLARGLSFSDYWQDYLAKKYPTELYNFLIKDKIKELKKAQANIRDLRAEIKVNKQRLQEWEDVQQKIENKIADLKIKLDNAIKEESEKRQKAYEQFDDEKDIALINADAFKARDKNAGEEEEKGK